MSEHRVEVKDSTGRAMRILVRLPVSGPGTWQALDHGYFCYEQGVVDTGYYPTAPLAWLALYGDDQIDDDNLVLHLDDFGNATTVNREGTGKIYVEDNLLAKPGALSWRLIDGLSEIA